MLMLKQSLICLGMAIILSSCRSTDLEVLDFQDVSMMEPQQGAELGSVDLSGIVTDKSSLTAQGFIYSEDTEQISEKPRCKH